MTNIRDTKAWKLNRLKSVNGIIAGKVWSEQAVPSYIYKEQANLMKELGIKIESEGLH